MDISREIYHFCIYSLNQDYKHILHKSVTCRSKCRSKMEKTNLNWNVVPLLASRRPHRLVHWPDRDLL